VTVAQDLDGDSMLRGAAERCQLAARRTAAFLTRRSSHTRFDGLAEPKRGDVVQGPQPERAPETIKDRLRGLLAAGAGTLVVASTVVVLSPAAASPPVAGSVIDRIEAVRTQLVIERLMREPDGVNPRLTWHTWHDWRDYKDHDQEWNNVGSWHNVGHRDNRWENWQNWHDWSNNAGDWGNRY
jgi:hypothetical protein